MRNKIKDMFSKVKEIRKSNRKRSGNNETSFESVIVILIGEDGSIVNKSSSDHEGFS